MSTVLPFIGALVLTYWLSRLLLRIRVPQTISPMLFLVAVHACSAAILGLWIGLVMMQFAGFHPGKAAVVLVPQLIWLGLDFARRRDLRLQQAGQA